MGHSKGQLLYGGCPLFFGGEMIFLGLPLPWVGSLPFGLAGLLGPAPPLAAGSGALRHPPGSSACGPLGL